jgi:hypothetical protein
VSTFLGLAVIVFFFWVVHLAVARPWYRYLTAPELLRLPLILLAGRRYRRLLRAICARRRAAALRPAPRRPEKARVPGLPARGPGTSPVPAWAAGKSALPRRTGVPAPGEAADCGARVRDEALSRAVSATGEMSEAVRLGMMSADEARGRLSTVSDLAKALTAIQVAFESAGLSGSRPLTAQARETGDWRDTL